MGTECSGPLAIAELIMKVTDRYMLGEDSKSYRITVRRGHLFQDNKLSLSNFEESMHLRVTFLGEPAVDDGGARREFFMLLLGDIANNGSLLDDLPNKRVLRHNAVAFKVQ